MEKREQSRNSYKASRCANIFFVKFINTNNTNISLTHFMFSLYFIKLKNAEFKELAWHENNYFLYL
jgi:hypothetical protein